ncbi:secretion/conjugation apparatus DotM-related subunit [Micavibrio aeruginosavorus]|uniref:DotM C-terminal cytoplasmic domain-containing protein n=1 Tax=Micavibrio aeruginosavorus (strain ARL-13) TaxID=856793 RepID=G2KR78_MICAA|nr:hypothetical protein [Micavibrio aeruginosavorus]AEP08730.1 hypothetical protein MICA_385 [Micavibrio aeruginosavorus ARL-13]
MSDKASNTTSENAVGYSILAVVFFCLFILFWYFNEYTVKDAFRWIRWAEMSVVSLVVPDDYSVNFQGQDFNFKEAKDAIATIPKRELNALNVSYIGTMSMAPFKYIFIAILAAIALWCQMYGPGTNNRRKLDLNGLIRAQAKNFPAVAPFVNFNPSTQPPRPPGSPVPSELPAFAEALGPEEWLAYNNIPMPDGKIDEGAAYMAFARQLGPRWQGWMKLPDYKQVLLAAFCLKASRKRADGDAMMGRIAACWSFEKGLQLSKDRKLVSDARKVLKNKDLAGLVLSRANQHAFHTTAMLRAMATAREEGGVLAPAQFVWLRAHDRTLWYPLNNLGRQAFHMEGLGAMAHYKAEKMTQRPIPRPKVEGAVQVIRDYMASDRARPVPQLDYKGGKRGLKKPKGSGKK